QGVTVSRLTRVRYGMLMLPEGLKTHSFYELQAKELDVLLESVGLEKEKPFAPGKQEFKGHKAGQRGNR
ncbi:MAG: 23S rRNA pseudouridine(2605) synthase RluB, partial [Gammaproteobacteria bacterium]